MEKLRTENLLGARPSSGHRYLCSGNRYENVATWSLPAKSLCKKTLPGRPYCIYSKPRISRTNWGEGQSELSENPSYPRAFYFFCHRQHLQLSNWRGRHSLALRSHGKITKATIRATEGTKAEEDTATCLLSRLCKHWPWHRHTLVSRLERFGQLLKWLGRCKTYQGYFSQYIRRVA